MKIKARWIILFLLFLASVINYVDRQTLSILAQTIQQDLNMSDLDYSHVVQMFLLAYMLSFLVAGWLTDKLGEKRALTLFIGWWSLANICTAFVRSTAGLATARFFLGAGESGLYTVAPKVVGRLFPPAQRGVAVGIYSAGATIGATLAPPLIAAIALNYGWRSAFVAGGVAGLVWLVPWLLFYRGPEKEPRGFPMTSAPSADPRDAIAPSPPPLPPPPPPPQPRTTWRDVIFCREALLLMGVRILTDPVWQFILFWFPKYMQDAHGMSLAAVGRVTWIVYLAADVGGIAIGFASGGLVRRGLRAADAHKWVLTACAVIIPCCALIPWLPTHAVIIAVVALVALVVFAFMVTLTALAVEVLPPDRLGSTFGIVAAGSGLGGILFAKLVGHLVTSYSYTPVFVLMAFLHPVSLLLVWAAARARRESAAAAGDSIPLAEVADSPTSPAASATAEGDAP
jgi:ACS family hexuronate transporter-like MFS transporter